MEKCVVYPITWAFALGAVGFLCGYMGPIFLNPNANRGPLLGLFFTGPLGLAIGGAAGLAFALGNSKISTQLIGLAVAAVLMATGVLYLCLPEPRCVGTVIEAEFMDCHSPNDLREEAISTWEGYIKNSTWRVARAGWKDSAPEMLARSGGVILELRVLGTREIYRQRRPWNNGELTATPWSGKGGTQSYFAHFRGPHCESYSTLMRRQYMLEWDASEEWPSDIPSSFLGLYELADVPPDFERLVGKNRVR